VINALEPPSQAHWLGTDRFGRDLLVRLARGGEISLMVGGIVTLVAMTTGTIIGCAAGYLGGIVDAVLMRCMDAILSFPGILLAMALVAALDPGLVSVILALSVVAVPRFARIVRGSVIQRRGLDFVAAAHALGCSPLRVLLRTILPNCTGPIIVQATLTLPGAILGEAGLSFLGLGTPPPAPSWGRMLFEARGYMEVAPEGAMVVGIAMTLTVMGFNFLGDGLRDVLDPKSETRK
jgi:peptide/nickel transport system permease protein